MFVFILRYVKPLEELDKALAAHREYLNKYIKLRKFICSGRQNPRIGGVILCKAGSRDEANEIIKEDPFYFEKLAEYEIIEFVPGVCLDEFQQFLDK